MKEPQDNMKESQYNMSQEEALADMQAELNVESINIQNTEDTTINPNETLNNAEKGVSISSNEKVLLKRVPRILAQIDQYVGDFFNSLKAVDERFANTADTFYSTAHSIASKKKITKEEFSEMAVNMAMGASVQGVGKIWTSIQTKEILNDVKRILTKEAQEKLGDIQKIGEEMADMVEIAEEQFDMCVQNGSDLQQLYEAFCNMRVLLYAEQLNMYLDATYTAAIEGEFQDDEEFPNMYNINTDLLESLLDDDDEDEDELSDEAIIEKHRENVKTLFESMKQTMSSGMQPTAPQQLVAKDQGLMAVAIYGMFPISLSSIKDDELVTIADDSALPVSAQYYNEIEELYNVAQNNGNDPLAQTLLRNEIFTNTVYHHCQTRLESEKFEKRNRLLVINVVLAAVAGFLCGLYLDWTWYWSLLWGVGVGTVYAKMSPFKSSRKKYNKKVTYIERTIQKSALNATGYKENINLKAIENQNNKTWLYVILGAIIGLIIFAPIGWLIGGIFGAAISGAGGDDKDNTDYDYTKVKVGSMTSVYIITALLLVSIIGLSYNMLFSSSDNKKPEKRSVENVETVVTEKEASDTDVEEAVVTEEAVYPEERPASDMGTYPVIMEGETVHTFVGNIGQYPIKMELVLGEEDEDGSQCEVDGRYKYTKEGNILTFSGRFYFQTGEYVLNEYTRSGRNSGRFNLKKQGNYLVGNFTNLSNGKEFEVKLELSDVD